MKHYEDAYYKSFTTGQYAELRAEQEALEGMTTWEDRVNGMSIIPLSTPMDVELRSIDPANKISKEILLDTADNLKLMIAYSGKEACLRDCAMPSLLSTVEIRGSGVFRPNPEQQAVALTALLTGCRENSRIMTRAGKVSAVVSHRYEPINTAKSRENSMKQTIELCLPEGLTIIAKPGDVTYKVSITKSIPDSVSQTDLFRNDSEAANACLRITSAMQDDKLMFTTPSVAISKKSTKKGA